MNPNLAADRGRAPESDWPTREQAYADAPSIIREIGWMAQTAADRPFGTEAGREFWPRKAALLDRIALDDDKAAEDATRAARQLMDRDGTAVICDPRFYVRQQYACRAAHS